MHSRFAARLMNQDLAGPTRVKADADTKHRSVH
jgi:hypothetical protein